MKSKTPVLATEYKFKGSREVAVASNGELNASSKKDLLNQQVKLLQATASGEIETASMRNERTKKNRQIVEAVFNSAVAHKEVGEVMGADLYQAANRRGFARKYLMRHDIVNGQLPYVKMRLKDALAVFSTSPTKVESQIVRDRLFTPPEILIQARIFIEQNELSTSASDVLEEKYNEAMEAIMVAEDKLWYMAANETVGHANDLTIISGTLTPQMLMEVRQGVAGWNLPVPSLLMASDLYVDIVGDSQFIQAIEPVARHELIMTGELAVLYGMTITSDAYRHPEHRVISKGEFFAISDPSTHGQYTDRGGIDTETLTGATEKIPGRGWLLHELYSSVIANPRSVAKGVRR